MEIIYSDPRIVVCLKPFGVLSTDEPDGMPARLREALGTPCIRTVHRLDRVVGGVMVFARSHEAAKRLSADIAARRFQKEYLAVVHGSCAPEGMFCDRLHRDAATRKTVVTDADDRDAQDAVLRYQTLQTEDGLSLVHIQLETGRTHQIRAQFSAHGFPIVGDRKYGAPPYRPHEIALWSYALTFCHPQTGETMRFECPPPRTEPWTQMQNRNQTEKI